MKRITPFSALALTTSVVACNAVLGIEDPIVTQASNGGAGGIDGGSSGGRSPGGSGSGGRTGDGGASVGGSESGGNGNAGSGSGGLGGSGAVGPVDASADGAVTDSGFDAGPPEVCGEAGVAAKCSPSGLPMKCQGGVLVPMTPCASDEMCWHGACIGKSRCFGVTANCGAGKDDGCCTALDVPGGKFNRDNGPAATNEATVSPFKLDKYEVTVGRFRKFYEGYPANRPQPGDGANPNVPGSGWNADWDTYLPATQSALHDDIGTDSSQQTWTNSATAADNRPMDYVTWYVAFAFCAWDGGRLPTEAEWNFAAAGGNEQRKYPWGNTEPAANYDLAVYNCNYPQTIDQPCDGTHIAPVGSAPNGKGKWGHMDLAGNVREWTFDYQADYIYPCTDCAQFDGTWRITRGGYWLEGAIYMQSSDRESDSAGLPYAPNGIRCAR